MWSHVVWMCHTYIWDTVLMFCMYSLEFYVLLSRVM